VEGLIRQRNWAPEVYGVLFNLMALFGLLMAAVGIVGMVSGVVASRTREFGVRLALGAAPADLHRMVLRQGGRVVAVGMGVGAILGLAFAQVSRSMVYGVSALDPGVYAWAIAFTGTVALLATYLPALKAGRVNPVRALNSE
jgi:ABC-type antimicrobial peptide transport system permease subunit